ncbi:MAG: putative lipid II flippase FtsW [Actinomycetota bacterium]|nr:putative lipid II flippase FtsW [Actinomycetota bacterium]
MTTTVGPGRPGTGTRGPTRPRSGGTAGSTASRVIPFPRRRTEARPNPGGGGGGGEAPRRKRRFRAPIGQPTGVFLATFGLVMLLLAVGLTMVLSASSFKGLQEYGSSWYHVRRQAMWAGIGVVAMLFTARIDYHRLRRWAVPGLLATFVLLGLVFVPGIGINVNGASRWVGYGPFRLQPGEVAKFTLLLFVADLLARRAHRMRDTHLTIRPVMVVFGVTAVLLMAQPDLGTTIVIGVIIAVVLFVAGAPLGRLAAIGGLGVVGALVLALAAPYRRNRLLSFVDPWEDPLETGYQTIQSWVAIASGGVTGVGIGAGRSKWNYLPEAHTDFIFAIIAEEFGLLGSAVVVALFIVLAILGVRIAVRAPDPFGTLLAAGITTWLLVQAFVNIGAVVGLLPITGLPLPFVSFGGTSLVVNLAATGVLLNVARQVS